MYNMLTMTNTFSDWLNVELKDRGWTMRELDRRSGLSVATISNVISGKTNPGLHFCVEVGRAFKMLPETVLRKAGLLPLLPPAVAEEKEAIALIRELPGRTREMIMVTLRALTSRHAPSAIAEAGASYETSLEQQLLETFRHLDPRWQDIVVEDLEQLRRNRLVRIIGGEDENLMGEGERNEEAPTRNVAAG